jgi:hypothetical protein
MRSDSFLVRAVAGLLAVTWFMLILARVLRGELTHDLAAYVAAADVFWAGGDPYDVRTILAAPRNQGFVYIYLPMSLWLIAPLAKLSVPVIIVVDMVMRGGAISFIAYTLARWFKPSLSVFYAIALVLCLFFTREDITDGNVGTLCFALWLALVAWPLGERRRGVWGLAGCVAAGALLACKPLWVPLACAGLAARGRWRAVGCVAAGAGAMVAASMAQGELWRSWLEMLAYHRAASATYDLMASQPWWTHVPPAALWLSGALWLLARAGRVAAPPPIWIWAGVGVMAWPRFGVYDLLLLVPALCWLASRGRAWLVAAGALVVPEALAALHFMELGPLGQMYFTSKLVGIMVAGVVYAALLRALDEAGSVGDAAR